MANLLSKDKQIMIISALAEGMSMRALSRMTDVHRVTINRLAVRVGQGCAKLMDQKMRNLTCRHIQLDEVWGFIGKKQRNLVVDDDPTKGDVWTFCAIDAETKLVPVFKVGKRTAIDTNAFISDLAGRLTRRVQISADGLKTYIEAIENAFGADVDFAQVIKIYTQDFATHPERKYSAPDFVSNEKIPVMGHPDMDLACTSHVERLNGITRQHMRRLSRLTLAFSKKLENFEAAVALHFAYYNFVRRHASLRFAALRQWRRVLSVASGVSAICWRQRHERGVHSGTGRGSSRLARQ